MPLPQYHGTMAAAAADPLGGSRRSFQLIILQSGWDALKSIPEIEKLHFQLEFICFDVQLGE